MLSRCYPMTPLAGQSSGLNRSVWWSVSFFMCPHFAPANINDALLYLSLYYFSFHLFALVFIPGLISPWRILGQVVLPVLAPKSFSCYPANRFVAVVTVQSISSSPCAVCLLIASYGMSHGSIEVTAHKTGRHYCGTAAVVTISC